VVRRPRASAPLLLQNSSGCYMLRSNVTDWSPEDLWRAYIQLTEAEAAFHIHKSDLAIRPVWHQREDRVQAHILVCFLSYVLWKTESKRFSILTREKGGSGGGVRWWRQLVRHGNSAQLSRATPEESRTRIDAWPASATRQRRRPSRGGAGFPPH
jgi:hypothetical protein